MPRRLGRKGVGQDGGGVGHQHGGADSLEESQDDQPDAGGVPRHPGDGQQEREEGEHREAEVVGAHPPVNVAQSAEGGHQDARHHDEPQDHPQQEEAVAGLQGIDADAAEDVRQGDEHDGAVDGGHEHAQGRDEQRRPLVAVGEWLAGGRSSGPGPLRGADTMRCRDRCGVRPTGGSPTRRPRSEELPFEGPAQKPLQARSRSSALKRRRASSSTLLWASSARSEGRLALWSVSSWKWRRRSKGSRRRST